MDNELYHHGVKGMKWRVRKTPVRSSSGATRKRKSNTLSLFKKKNTTRNASVAKSSPSQTKSVKDMSDDELRRKIERVRLEQQYQQLNPKTVSRGQRIAKRVMNNVIVPAAEDLGKQVVKSFMATSINKALSLEGDSKVYANNKKKS